MSPGNEFIEALVKDNLKAPAARTASHTPGPWFVDLDPPKYARIRAAADRWIVAMVGNNENTDARTESDARLIAAAPALADALERLVGQLDGMRDFVCPDGGAESLAAARAALRAAGLSGERSEPAEGRPSPEIPAIPDSKR